MSDDLAARIDRLCAELGAWLTLALDITREATADADLLRLRDWVDAGCDEGALLAEDDTEAQP